jgi:tungstate transport system ATP-binding protein
MSALLELHGLTKRFGERHVLADASLELAAGRRYVLTGDNGAGKTTLLKILAGLESATATRFRFSAREYDIARYPIELRRDIVYVHQHPYLFHSSVAANLAYGLARRDVAHDERAMRVAQAMAWAGVEHLRHAPPHKLSGGEKQRVAIARARILNPRVLLLDEPTANLDADARHQIAHLLEELVSNDTCVVVACHDREIIALPGTVRLHLEEGDIAERNGIDNEKRPREAASSRS